MQAVYAQIDRRALTRLDDLILDLLTHLGNDLFDASRMDASVLHQLMQSQTGDLATYRVET